MENNDDQKYTSSVGGRLNHPDDMKKYFSSKSFKEIIAQKNNSLVYTTLTMEGKDFLETSTYEIDLHQTTNDHDYFIIDVPDDALDSMEGYVLEHSKNILGKRVTLNFHRFGEVKQMFTGVITSVKNKKENGYGRLYIKVSAPSMLLENGAHSQSYEEQALEQIIQSATTEYPEDCRVLVNNPNTKYRIPYTVQYKESDYQFIKRLATRYGEYFYYNGQNMVFGNKVQPIIDLEENMDLIDVEFELNIKPQLFRYSSYDSESGSKIEKESSSSEIQYKENPFQAVAINASKKAYQKKPEMHFNHTGISSVSDRELTEAVRRERENRENLVLMKGSSRDPELKIGGRAKLSDIRGKAMETYRIIEIKHHHDGNVYYNEFVGIPDLFNAPYQDSEALPLGEQQSAKVLENNDPKGMGRVRVQFPWQERKNTKTPWIRTSTIYAGAERGDYKIPEIGDEVLVSFESGNAEKPYVSGAMYNGVERSGYATPTNRYKVHHSRIGNRLIMDDDTGDVTLESQKGQTIAIFYGDGNISIKAPENINISAGKSVNITAGESVNVSAGMNISENAGMNHSSFAGAMMVQNAIADYSLMAANITNIASDKITKEAKDYTKQAEKIEMYASKENIQIKSSKSVQTHSGEKSHNS